MSGTRRNHPARLHGSSGSLRDPGGLLMERSRNRRLAALAVGLLAALSTAAVSLVRADVKVSPVADIEAGPAGGARPRNWGKRERASIIRGATEAMRKYMRQTDRENCRG